MSGLPTCLTWAPQRIYEKPRGATTFNRAYKWAYFSDIWYFSVENHVWLIFSESETLDLWFSLAISNDQQKKSLKDFIQSLINESFQNFCCCTLYNLPPKKGEKSLNMLRVTVAFKQGAPGSVFGPSVPLKSFSMQSNSSLRLRAQHFC